MLFLCSRELLISLTKALLLNPRNLASFSLEAMDRDWGVGNVGESATRRVRLNVLESFDVSLGSRVLNVTQSGS